MAEETATATDTVPQEATATEATATEQATPEEKDWRAEAEKWKNLARKHEGTAKSNAEAARRLAEFEESQKSETEKAISEAEKRARQATLSEVGQRLAAAEIKAALTGVVTDPAAIVEDLNLARYVTGDGDVDAEAVTALRSKYEALVPKADNRPRGSADQGVRSNGDSITYSRAQLRDPKFFEANQADILRAAREGRITD